MLQAPILECLSLDPFSSFDDGGSPAAIDIGRRHIVESLVVALVVVVLDEGLNLSLEVAGQVVVLEQDPVLECLVSALDLALGLRMARSAADMRDALLVEPLGQVIRDVAGAVVGEQSRPVQDLCLIAA